MVALRKDVKLGLTIGGIVLSVVGVYVGLTALAGEKNVNAAEGSNGVTLVGGETSGSPAGSGAQASLTKSGKPDAARIDQSKAVVETAKPTTPTGVPGTINPTTPLTASGSTNAAGSTAGSDDPWASAFNSGRIAPAITTTPDPAAARANRQNATPADVIHELNKPTTPAAPTNGAGRDATANAGDPSGSLSGGGQKAVLTQGGSQPSGTQVGNGAASNGGAAAGETTEYVVANGDTLSSIATEHYGNAKYFNLIIEANPNVDANRLKIGTKLRIPARKADAPGATAGSTSGTPATTNKTAIDPSRQYVVKSGDSLHKIASELYGDSAQSERLYNANKALIGDNPARLKVGMVLTLPEPPAKKS